MTFEIASEEIFLLLWERRASSSLNHKDQDIYMRIKKSIVWWDALASGEVMTWKSLIGIKFYLKLQDGHLGCWD